MVFKNLPGVFLITLLVLLSLFPRSIEVLNGNPVFGIDQGRDYLAAKSIVVDRKLTLIGAELGAGQAGISYLFHGPGYFYLLTIPFILFNGNPVGGVWLMLMLSLSAIAFGYYFIAKFWGRKAGLLFAFLLALCPYLIGQARLMENHFATTILILIVFYFTYLFTKTQRKGNPRKFIFLAAFFSAFVYNFEFAIAVPMCITFVFYSLTLLNKQFLRYVSYLILGFLLGFLPMIFFEFRHGFMGTQSLFGYVFLPHETPSPTPLLLHAQNIVSLFIYAFSDAFPAKLLQLPKDIIFFGFVGLTLFVFLKEKDRVNKNFLFFLLLLFPVNFFVFLLLRNIVFQHYITDLLLVCLLFLTYNLMWLYKNRYFKLAVVLSIYLVLLLSVGAYNAYTVSVSDYKDYGGVHKLRGKLDAIDYIYKDANKEPFGLFVFAPPVYTYPYDYLIWWYGQKKYGYTPHNEKRGIFYLLIEKDSSKPWSYKGWQETVIKTGEVTYTKTLPSGFILEKRIGE